MLKAKGRFNLKGPYGLLINKAIAYADEQNLNPNYINLTIPDEHYFTTGSSRVTNNIDLDPAAQAHKLLSMPSN